jgi:hypothetical protein
MAKHAEHHSGIQRQTAFVKELFPGRFEASAVSHAGRASRLAPATAEAGIEVFEQPAVARIDFPSLQRAHQHDPSARTMPLVSGY